jgi:hypothetical protein
MSGELQEDFQSYMDGGVRRPKRGVRAAPRRSASPKRRPAAAAAKRVAPKRRTAPKRHPMASLYGGFFESLEGFANEVAADKKKKVEMYADDKNPMEPLAMEATKGGAKKAKSKAGVKKPKTGVKKPKTGVKKSRTKHHGGYEEQEQEQQEQEQQEQEDFVNIQDAVDKVQQLLSGGYLRRRVAPKRRPAAATSPKRRPAAAASPKRRPAALKRRVVRSYA